ALCSYSAEHTPGGRFGVDLGCPQPKRGLDRRALGAVHARRAGLDLKLRRFLIFVHDVGAAALAWMVAFCFRFNFDMTPPLVDLMLEYLPYTVLVHAAVFSSLGLYRGMWRHSSLSDLKRILIAVGLAA